MTAHLVILARLLDSSEMFALLIIARMDELYEIIQLTCLGAKAVPSLDVRSGGHVR